MNDQPVVRFALLQTFHGRFSKVVKYECSTTLSLYIYCRNGIRFLYRNAPFQQAENLHERGEFAGNPICP